MRLHHLRFDIWLYLLVAYPVSLGTEAAASALGTATYDSYAEVHSTVPGQAGSSAGPEVPRTQSIAELLELDTFTVPSQGIAYRNEGAGYFEGSYLYNLALPFGERVAARIRTESAQDGEKFASGEVVLPVGRVVWVDLEENPAFLEQITSGYPLDRTDFCVDMAGEAVRYSQKERTENHVIVVQLVTVLVCFPLLHALGSCSGIFLAFFPTMWREKAGRN